MTDLVAFRDQFPALQRVTYLNNATAAPGAIPVLEALRRVEGEWEAGEFSWQAWEAEGEATRELFARLLGGRAQDVALLPTLAEAAATVAGSLPPGRVVVGEREFTSNLFPWLALRDRGFEVVEVPASDGVTRTAELVEAITEGTVLVAVTEVQSSNGFRVHLEELGRRCREVGARLFVDGCQSLGALRLDADAAGVDFVAAHGYKWLLAPRGAAWLWVRPERLRELRPLAPNWKSIPDPYSEYYGGPLTLASTARKLDAPLAWFCWPAARSALELLATLDPDAVERRCLELAAAFRDEAIARGFDLVPEDAPTQVVAIRVSDPGEVRERLLARKVIGAVRANLLRLGFHAYNDESDVAAALDALGDV
ncbi:MAG TPA: aminotransferase class V-fold PLP-dependent enzyme [Actinomycetota bacterium]|nr:aminotransferase class V-fold PLP-dependent enzyme [Actinomycetota bacterium]